MTEAACCKNVYFVLLQTLNQVQGDGLLFYLLAAFGICGATCLWSEGETYPSLRNRLFVCGFQFLQVLVGFGLLLFALGFFFLLLKEFVEGLVKDGWRYRL